MILNKKILAIVIAMLLIPNFANATTVDSAKSFSGGHVIDSRGNCVRTKWLQGEDPCGYDYPKAEVAAPVLEDQTVERQRTVTSIDLVRQSVYFDIDKDEINIASVARIQEVINELQNSSGVKSVKMVGYADRFAGDKYNLDLSKRRASNVLYAFRNQGYFNEINVGFGFYGSRKPVTNCPYNVSKREQIACLQADRRVDIEVELLRTKLETYTETVKAARESATNPLAQPGIEKPGTVHIEVFSRPIDPRTVNFDQNGVVYENPAPGGVSVQENNAITVPTPAVQKENENLFKPEVQSIDALKNRY